MNQVRERLWIGDSADAVDTAGLEKAGITCVINVAFDLDDPKYDPQKFKTIKVGLVDGPGNPPCLKVLAVATVIAMYGTGEKVLVHCHQGIGRSAWVVAMFLARVERITFDTAYQELRGIRPQIREVNRLREG